ncbi:MAG: TonB-dependent receptor plug [Bryobacterales bacterium]|nr:TonB-dependent receptor plug [Bryobacterales bacterium]
MRSKRIALCLLLLLSLSGLAIAQVLYGNLVGSVTDPQQGAITTASVKLQNRDTGFATETKTDDRGSYDIGNIPPGNYDITIVSPGFNTFEAKQIAIQANNVVRIDAALKVGSVNEVVTVGAEAASLQTDRSDLHTDIESKTLSSFSVGGYRNYQSLLDLVPGTTPAQFQNASTDSPSRALTSNVNGTARNSNNTRIDGAASIFTWLPHHTYYVPALESIETVNISTNNFDAEQGMSGGAAVSVFTKSGTNTTHGVLFAYHSNHKWGAKNLFFNPNTPAGPGTPQRIDNQYGGTLGGKIIKDKLFYFASWEGTTTAERGNALRSVPTLQIRNGDFNGLTTVYDPATGDSSGRNRTAFPGNVVPANRFSPQALALQNLIPLPNTGSGQTTNYFASAPYYFKRDQVDGKLNWTPSSKMNVFAKYSVMIAPVTASPALGAALGGYPGGAAGAAGIGTGHNRTDIYAVGISYVISPTLLFDANYGGTLMHHDTTGPDYGKNIGLDVLKIPGTNGPDPRQSGFPIFNISGYTSLGNTDNWSPVERNDRLYTYAANMNWTKGAHNVRFGVDLLHHQMNHWQPELGSWSPRGGFTFSNGVTGLSGGPAANNFNAFASFLLGLPAQMGKAYQFYDPMQTREVDQGYYIRDNWQVTRKLILNLGMRFEHFPIMNRGQYGIERYDPVTNKVLIGGRGNVPRDAGTHAKPILFAPRIGLAYRYDDKTVFRAGFGITNDPYPLSRPMRSPYPAVIVDQYDALNSFVPAGDLRTGIPAVKFPDLSTGVVDIPNTVTTNSLQPGDFRRGYIESFNLTIQREIGAGFVLQTGYVGTRSIRQTVTYFEINAGLVPGAGAAGRPLFNQFNVNVNRSMLIPMATNRYDAWQSNLSKRYGSGLSLTSSYTWSKTIGINAGNSDVGLRFYVPSQYSKNKAVADFDRTHSFVLGANYELPFGKGKPMAKDGVSAKLFGGWRISPTVGLYTGTPFSVTADGASLNAPQNTQVADQITGTVQKFGGVGVGAPFYDPAAFRAITEPRFGNTGLNILRGPLSFNNNLGVHRQFAVRERMDLQFRAEFLNLTNTPALGTPNASVSTPSTFMIINSTNSNVAAPQRTIRFGLRLAF